uniref:Uncharacterized protein AlNc14C381G11225 n=1 Tax=Albugo laibachii Nc14 TaxID=890382 RepID=F0WYG5_9STRA|nr:conserved hypothetical protein [Albugo laibachii Nc14]|eukprot:CCA26519.1 conserved hypothetical protein [Albugo laibachii Nc14]
MPDSTESDATTLTREQLKSCLVGLKIHPVAMTHAYTTVNISSLHLSDIQLLSEYPNIMHVNCSGNQLTSLSPLQHLNLLLSVDASENDLAQALDFDTPRCTNDNASIIGKDWFGSTVQYANLNANRIEKIRNLSLACPFLTELHLSGNEIKEIDGIEGLRYLRVLDLSSNCLKMLKGLASTEWSLPALEDLKLGNNVIASVEEIACLPCLLYLDVNHNNISTLSPLQASPSAIASPKIIEDFNELNNLIPHKNFESLEIDGNPLTRHCGSKVISRARILRRLQQLAILDGDLVTSKEKVKAMVMHGSEIPSRKEVFQMYLPRHSFIDDVDVLNFDEDQALNLGFPVDGNLV